MGPGLRREDNQNILPMPEFEWQFTLVLLTNGVMIGLMYALIALGFVLIYKATDAINFAQGEFVMFAGFIAAGAADLAGAPFWVSALLSVAGMVALGFGLERVVLRPLIGRPVIAVVMATIGLAAVLRGGAVLAFGAGTRAIEMPVGDTPLDLGPVMLSRVQLVGAGVSLVFLALLPSFFLKSRVGIALGAVVGGLIVGVVENLAAGYLDPYVGGGTKDFAPYVLMIVALMLRPEGMFGRRRIERV